jgi:hypothetical protein
MSNAACITGRLQPSLRSLAATTLGQGTRDRGQEKFSLILLLPVVPVVYVFQTFPLCSVPSLHSVVESP